MKNTINYAGFVDMLRDQNEDASSYAAIEPALMPAVAAADEAPASRTGFSAARDALLRKQSTSG